MVRVKNDKKNDKQHGDLDLEQEVDGFICALTEPQTVTSAVKVSTSHLPLQAKGSHLHPQDCLNFRAVSPEGMESIHDNSAVHKKMQSHEKRHEACVGHELYKPM